MQVSVKMHDPLKVKQGVHKSVAELNNQGILPVRVNDCVHFHRPDQKEVAFDQFICILVDFVNIRLSRAHQDDFTIGMPVRLVTPVPVSGGQIESAVTVKSIVFVLAVIHAVFSPIRLQLKRNSLYYYHTT